MKTAQWQNVIKNQHVFFPYVQSLITQKSAKLCVTKHQKLLPEHFHEIKFFHVDFKFCLRSLDFDFQ